MFKPHSIGNTARLAGVAVSTLRSWEEHGLITPEKSAAGHRYYSPHDVERAQLIKRYRRFSGMSIASIKRRLLQDNDSLNPTFPSDQDTKNQESLAVGAKVRQLRKQRGWSIRELSRRSGITVSQLSTFERGYSALGLARLNIIATLFDTGLAELLGGTETEDFPVFRRGSGRIVKGMSKGVSIEQVTVAERLMDVEFWTIEPGEQSDGFYSHEGEEFIYVIEGEFELTLITSGSKILYAGESAYFSSRIKHRWRNISTRPSKLLWINTDSERLASMHFDKAKLRTGTKITK